MRDKLAQKNSGERCVASGEKRENRNQKIKKAFDRGDAGI
jgi:hypothetical protein